VSAYLTHVRKLPLRQSRPDCCMWRALQGICHFTSLSTRTEASWMICGELVILRLSIADYEDCVVFCVVPPFSFVDWY
jgi:hypothetical protein